MAHPEFEKYRKNKAGKLRSIYRIGDDTGISLPQGKSAQDAGNIDPPKGRYSIINRHSIFSYPYEPPVGGERGGNIPKDMYFGTAGNNEPAQSSGGQQEDEGKQNAVDRSIKNPTASVIINKTREGKFNAMEYEWGDFLYALNYGKVPNNYMVTLRRFGSPCEDNLLDDQMNPNPDIGRMVAWIDEENNSIEDLLSFSVGFNWEEMEAEVQTLDANKQGFGSLLPGGLSADEQGRETLREGEQRSNFDPVENFKNRVYGPIDVIDKMLRRDRGLNFEQEITVTFDYELRSVDGINPRVALLDVLSNILAVTYNQGEFWGGETRFAGAGKVNQPMGEPNKLMEGDFTGYISSMFSDAFGSLSNIFGGGDQGSNSGEGPIKTVTKNIGAMLGGMAMDKMGRPEIQAIHSLLTGQATGEHHLTIGNPLNPIAMIGNLAIQNTEISFKGPMGNDDFPSGLRAEVTLKHARPRDKWDVESMFNGGRGRMYGSTMSLTEKEYYLNVQKGESPDDISAESSKENVEGRISTGVPPDVLAQRFPHFSKSKIKEQSKWL